MLCHISQYPVLSAKQDSKAPSCSHPASTFLVCAVQAAVGALQNVRTLMRSDLYTIAALDGHTRKHLEVSTPIMLSRYQSC